MPEVSHRPLTDHAKPERTSPHTQSHIVTGQASPLAVLVQRAQFHPQTLTAHEVLQLQRSLGNRAVGQLMTSASQPQPIKQPTSNNRIQRVIHELWNVDTGKPNKRPLNKYSALIKANWEGVNNDMISDVIATELIKNLFQEADLITLANSNQMTKAVYDHYKANPGFIVQLVRNGATKAQLKVSMLVQGEKATANADNLNWFHQNHQPAVELVWHHWFPYTHGQTYAQPTYDAEVGVRIGKYPFGVIHVHYPKDAPNDSIKQANIDRIHIKRDASATDKYLLGDVWKGLCQGVIDQHVADRPQ